MKMFYVILVAVLAAGLPGRAGNVEAEFSGPSGQGDLIYKAPATGVTNLVMGTGGLYNVTFDPAYAISGNTADAVTNVEIATTVDALDSITPVFSPAVTAATATVAVSYATNEVVAVTVTGGDMVVTNATITLQWSGSLFDTNGVAITNAAGEEVSLVTNATLTLQTGAVTAEGSNDLAEVAVTVSSQTSDFISGITSNVVTPMNSITYETTTVLKSEP